MVTGWVGIGRAAARHVRQRPRAQPVAGAARAARRRCSSADLVYCDGYGVRIAAKALDLPTPHRMTGADWIWTPRRAVRGVRAARSTCSARSRARPARPPSGCGAGTRGCEIAGTHHGFFGIGSPHAERVVEDINERRPDIVLVGMGTPKQEDWVEHLRRAPRRPTSCGPSARCSTTSRGRVPRAPGWLADNGLEWIFRLGVEPKRMWRRYLLGNPMFLSRVLAETARRADADAALPLPLRADGPPRAAREVQGLGARGRLVPRQPARADGRLRGHVPLPAQGGDDPTTTRCSCSSG